MRAACTRCAHQHLQPPITTSCSTMSASQQLLLFVLLAVPCITAVRPRIAVIGSGVGGASTAYFVRQRLPTAHITVFEKAQRTGGRTHTIDFPSASGPRLRVDAGATSISTLNRYFVAFVDQFGLQKAAAVPGATQLGIWDGQRTFFRSGEQSWKLLWNALLRWGVTPALLIHRLHDGIAKWLGIYALQQQNRSFRSPEAMFKALQLWNLTQVPAHSCASRTPWRGRGQGHVQCTCGAVRVSCCCA